jgi:hypothetical protein
VALYGLARLLDGHPTALLIFPSVVASKQTDALLCFSLEHARTFFVVVLKMTNKSINSHRIASSIDGIALSWRPSDILYYIYIVIENERYNEQHYSINNNNKDVLCDRHESSHGVWRIGGNDCQGSVNWGCVCCCDASVSGRTDTASLCYSLSLHK